MKKHEFVQVHRNLLLNSIKDMHSFGAGLPKYEMNNLKGRMFVAHLSGLLKDSEPEVSKALFDLVQGG